MAPRWPAALGAACLVARVMAVTPALPMAPAVRSATVPSAAAPAASDPRRSGFDFMSRETQAMQRDDAQNPALLWSADGEALWNERPALDGRETGRPSCAGCHGAASRAMRGVAARYPRFDATAGRPLALHQRIAACRERYQQMPAWRPESQPLLALEVYIGQQSRGVPIRPDDDPRSTPWRERGAVLYRQRLGQLDLACTHCHDDQAGQRLGGATVPQAHPTAYPIYRLEWQGVGSLWRRLRGCIAGVRAEPFPADAPQWVELELYLASRAGGMLVETPGVRP